MEWNERTGAARALIALRRLGLPAEELQLLRMGENVIFKVRNLPYVVRVHRPGKAEEEVRREIDVAAELAGHMVPVVWPASDVPDPLIVVEDSVVTLWQWVESVDATRDFESFGRLMRRLHDEGRQIPVALPDWNPWPKVRRRLATYGYLLSTEDLRLLQERVELVEGQLANYDLARTFIHGDAHYGNTLMTPGGLVILDFEEVANGPLEWDFAPTVVASRHFGLPQQDVQSFFAGYGPREVDQQLLETLERTRELTMTTWLLQLAVPGSAAREELLGRLATLLGREGRLWKPL